MALPANQCTALRRPPFNPHSLPRVRTSRLERGEAEWTTRWGHLTRTTCYEAWCGSRLDRRPCSSVSFLAREDDHRLSHLPDHIHRYSQQINPPCLAGGLLRRGPSGPHGTRSVDAGGTKAILHGGGQNAGVRTRPEYRDFDGPLWYMSASSWVPHTCRFRNGEFVVGGARTNRHRLLASPFYFSAQTHQKGTFALPSCVSNGLSFELLASPDQKHAGLGAEKRRAGEGDEREKGRQPGRAWYSSSLDTQSLSCHGPLLPALVKIGNGAWRVRCILVDVVACSGIVQRIWTRALGASNACTDAQGSAPGPGHWFLLARTSSMPDRIAGD